MSRAAFRFAMPKAVRITGRSSSITNSFVNGIVPIIRPTPQQIDEALALLGMEDVVCAYCGDMATEWDHLRPLAERMVTFAKRGDLHARRRVMTVIRDKGVVHVLFTEIAPQVADRPGGYTRITKVGPRKGDNAPMAVIELVLEPLSPKQATVAEATAATKRAASRPWLAARSRRACRWPRWVSSTAV